MKRQIADQTGSALLITALSIVTLILVTGAGIDLGRQQLVHTRMQQASDAAALAAGTAPEDSDPKYVGARYYNLNYLEPYMGVSRPAADVEINASTVTVAANSSIQNKFISVQGSKTAQIWGHTTAEIDTTQYGQHYDIVMVMDVSGSMGQVDCGSPPQRCGFKWPDPTSRMALMRVGVENFLNDIFGDSGTSDSFTVANVFFAGHTPPLSQTDKTFYNTRSTLEYLYFQKLYNPQGKGMLVPNYEAGTIGGSAAQVAKPMIEAEDTKHVRVAILETDGQNTDADHDQPDPQEDQEQLAACADMKAQGILVYTIAFGSDQYWDHSIRDRMRQCASGTEGKDKDTYALTAVTGSELNNAFNNIITTVKTVHIVQ